MSKAWRVRPEIPPRAVPVSVRAWTLFAFGCVVLSGCTGWTRAVGGMAYPTSGRSERAGPVAAIDFVLQPAPHTVLNQSSKPIPFGLHTTLQTQLAPGIKSVSWGTGVAFYSAPRPVSPYLLAGTNLHVDYIRDYWSFGNFQPYAELGLAAAVGKQAESGQRGPIVTLGLEGNIFVHYLAFRQEGEPTVDGFFLLKFGFGYELQ